MTASRMTLVSWVGTADLVALSESMTGHEKETFCQKLRERIRRDLPPAHPPGPVKALLEARKFDEVHLLSDWWPEATAAYADWLGHAATLHPTSLTNPTDYVEVVEETKKVLDKLNRENARRAFHFHLSPGTPTMAAVWFMWANSLYPAALHQTHNSTARQVELPYEIEVELRERFRRTDRLHRQLAEGGITPIEGFEGIIGDSPRLQEAKALASKAAIRDVPVLLLGESGTGKEVFAQAIHRRSSRSGKPFVAVNIAAVPEELIEGELFGAKKGSHSVAYKDLPGAFGRADGGTLFLDEIGESSPNMQAKLLRALEPGPNSSPTELSIRPVGGDETTVNVRVITATNRDLLHAIRDDQFRDDLYYRISPVVIRLPPLRRRRADIAHLADHLLKRINADFDAAAAGAEPYVKKVLTSAAIERLQFKQWKGNVRQLRSVLLRAAVLTDAAELDADDIEAAMDEGGSEAGPDLRELPLEEMKEALAELERAFLERAFTEAGTIAGAAKLLKVPRKTVSDRMRELGVDRSD